MSKPRPTGITADRNQKTVTIEWNNGRSCTYTFAGLRAVCPCVECKGGHAHMGGPPDMGAYNDAYNPQLSLEDIGQVGSYALQFHWNDGHHTGIYTWDYLLQVCSGEGNAEIR
jgi:DUF971 family protein